MNMSIRNKLYLAFAALIGLLAIISVIIFVTGGSTVRANKAVIETSSFGSQAKTFQKQHSDWLIALANHLFIGTQFDKHLNPHECAFGKWYYSYIQSDEFKHQPKDVQKALKDLEEPHRRLHEGGAMVISELKEGRKANAIKLYQENTLPTITELDGIYGSLIEASTRIMEDKQEEASASERTGNVLVILILVVGSLLSLPYI